MHSQKMHTRNFSAHLDRPEGIASLMPQARRLIELRGILAAALPESLARSCLIANYRQGKVVIFAANNAVAAKLKLISPKLLQHFSGQGIEVTGMEVRVQPPGQEVQPIEKTAKFGETAQQELARLWEKLPESELKSAVGKMARRRRE